MEEEHRRYATATIAMGIEGPTLIHCFYHTRTLPRLSARRMPQEAQRCHSSLLSHEKDLHGPGAPRGCASKPII